MLRGVEDYDPIVKDTQDGVAAVDGWEVGPEELLANQTVQDLCDGVLGKNGTLHSVVSIETGEASSEDTG